MSSRLCPLLAISRDSEPVARTPALPPKADIACEKLHRSLKADIQRGSPERPLYPRKQTLVAQERLDLKKRTLDVRFTPESGRKWVTEFMSAFNPKRT